VLAPSLAAVACNVFQPPPLVDSGSGENPITSEDGSLREGGSSGSIDATTDVPKTMPEAGIDGTTGGDAGGGDGGSPTNDGSTQPWWPYTNNHGCMSAGVPLASDRPAVSDPGPAISPIYVAISRFRVGSANNDPALTQNLNAWADIGFDLDGVCTNSATCVDPSDPSGMTFFNDPGCQNNILIPYDGNLCRDNALGKSFGIAAKTSQVGQWFGFTEQDFNCELLRGSMGVIFKISEYNGQLNDAQVRVDMYNNIGLVNLPSWKCRQTIDTPLDPSWSGGAPWMSSDPWIIDSRSISLAATDAGNDLPEAKTNDTGAYVRNGWLVAHLLPDGAAFWFDAERTSVGINAPPGSFPGFQSHMYRSVLAARIAKGPDGYWGLTNGTLAWVEPATDILQAFRDMGFCENMCQGYQQLKNYLNVNLDSIITAPFDQALPNTPCDSLSAGWAFEARQATVSPAYIQPSTLPYDCPEPLSMLAPRQGAGCNCEAGLGCPPDDASTESGVVDAAAPDSGSADTGSSDAGGN
jgi:hypothetical protein